MKTKLVSALGLALLAASLTFNSSFACSQSSEATISALPVIALESNEAAPRNMVQPIKAVMGRYDRRPFLQPKRLKTLRPGINTDVFIYSFDLTTRRLLPCHHNSQLRWPLPSP